MFGVTKTASLALIEKNAVFAYQSFNIGLLFNIPSFYYLVFKLKIYKEYIKIVFRIKRCYSHRILLNKIGILLKLSNLF